MAQRKTLNERQIDLLRWIGEGCPAGVMEGESCRISAAALRRRGLVTTDGHGPSWSASITPTGREYLDRCDGQNPPTPRQANGSVTEQLVRDVVEAGGSLRLPRGRYLGPGQVDYERRARLAEQYGKVPPGKRLVVRRPLSPSYEELLIELVDAPEKVTPALEAVPVPSRLTRAHPVVEAFREVAETLEISRAALPRAARILQGLVVEAERRGHQVTAPRRTDGSGRTGARRGTVSGAGAAVISIDGHSFEVNVREEGLPSRGYWERRNGSYRYGSSGIGEWVPPPRSQYEATATGRLTLSLADSYAGRQHSWSDRKRWAVEEKLPDLLREVELRAAEAQEREREKQRQAEERQRSWEHAMERARERFLEERRAASLASQVERWQRAGAIRAYCAAAEEAHPESAETAEWIIWARRYSDYIDPLSTAPAMPSDPEQISPEDLKPFLGRWSPYGPDRW